MAVIEKPEKLGLKPVTEFDEANATWPRGDRPAAIREAATEFRARFATEDNRVRAVRTVDIASAGYPLKFAFGGAARGPNPYINIINRLQVVQFEDFEGRLRTLAYEPTVPEGPAEAPFYAQQIERLGEFLSYKVLANIYNSVPEALAKAGLRPEEVDYISFDHLHVQDVRFTLGSSEPLDGETGPLPALFPNAKLLTQRKEWDTFRSLHPMQWAWYVEDGIKGVPEENVVLLEGDIELGKGMALIWTPGHTDGNHSLCINTPEGVWVSSENGVSADSWHPHLSKIPGVRKFAEFFNREVVLNSNTLEDSIDQYDSMLKEKALADPNRRDPRYLNVFPSSEMADWKRQWPVVPTFWYGGINYGTIERPPSGNGRRA
ncbi:MAG TPA: hypothetical protein VK920_08940 [Solirubrobacterales bacterium]|nr:hypothetical protein [Solirubrobacterales bacterium]